MSEYTVPAPCPICGIEIRMSMEETDDGVPYDSPYGGPIFWWQAVGIAPDDEQEFEEPHSCALTDDRIEEMIRVATERAQTDYFRYDPYEPDY